MREAVALEFDLARARRGDRDDIVRGLLCELTGAEDATVVNNNAAAVLLVLNTLAQRRADDRIARRADRNRRSVPPAGDHEPRRHEARRSRHHQPDPSEGLRRRIDGKSGLILKVHTSNYRIAGFTAEVPARELAALGRERGVPLVNDLGSGTLVDLSRFGLAARADRCRSGGGRRRPCDVLRRQAAGRPASRICCRTQRPDRAHQPQSDEAGASRRQDPACRHRGDAANSIAIPTVSPRDCQPFGYCAAGATKSTHWRTGSFLPLVGATWDRRIRRCEIGGLREPSRLRRICPLQPVPSAGIAIRPTATRAAPGGRSAALAAALCRLPVPVIGRIEEQTPRSRPALPR